ncbi:precursor of CEP3 [Neltuma alba]|uniref:precursor of CEP3 n=1 Tax=Neltuma alba TaxID=207710 RepID=UPI0010A542FC|nr:precursor of CEP3-like [Prosopis alba]
MAQSKLVLCFVVLALTLCLELSSIEGRYLKSEGNENFVKREVGDAAHRKVLSTTNATTQADVSPPSPAAAEGHDVSDFRPTNPGHSPGVGHSVHN